MGQNRCANSLPSEVIKSANRTELAIRRKDTTKASLSITLSSIIWHMKCYASISKYWQFIGSPPYNNKQDKPSCKDPKVPFNCATARTESAPSITTRCRRPQRRACRINLALPIAETEPVIKRSVRHGHTTMRPWIPLRRPWSNSPRKRGDFF